MAPARRFWLLEDAISEPLSDAWFDVVWARGAMRFGSRERLGRLWGGLPWGRIICKNNSLARCRGAGGAPEEPSRRVQKDPTGAALAASDVGAPKVQINYKNKGFGRSGWFYK